MFYMGFIARHRSDILAALKRHGLQELEVDFIKRRGRICTRHRESGLEFRYLRKKETRLDPFTQNWVDVESFKIRSGNSQEVEVESWENVMQAFNKWLSQF